MVSLGEYIDRIDTFERREKFRPFSGLMAMYGFLDDMPLWNRMLLRLQVWLRFRGIQRVGYDSPFGMYRGLRGRIRDCVRQRGEG